MELIDRWRQSMKRCKWTTEIAIVAVALLIVIIASACHSGYRIGTAAKAIEDNWQYILAEQEQTAEESEEIVLTQAELAEEEAIEAEAPERTLDAPQICVTEIGKEIIPEEITALKMANIASEEAKPEWSWTEADEQILVKIAMAEAGGEGVIGKALVMRVVINRAESDRFPNTIDGVVFQKLGDVYQFSPVSGYGVINGLRPDEECYEALEMIKDGWDDSEGATFFEAAPNTASTWHSRNLKYLFRYGGHSFYDLP